MIGHLYQLLLAPAEDEPPAPAPAAPAGGAVLKLRPRAARPAWVTQPPLAAVLPADEEEALILCGAL